MPFKDSEKQKEYYRKYKRLHSDRIKKRSRRYYLANRNTILKQHREYQKNHKEQIKREHLKYYKKHRQHILDTINKGRLKIRKEVIAKYGGKCACCGESILEFLTIDHINGRERGDRKTGIHCYYFLKKENYPEGYQVLCWNCNSAKGLYGKCPHKNE